MSAESKITIRLVDEFSKGFAKLQKTLSASGKSLSSVGKSMQSFGLQATAMTAPIALMGKNMISRVSDIEQFKVALDTMLGSTEAGSRALNEFQKFASTTPFDLREVVAGGNALLAMGSNIESVVPQMTYLGNAAAATGADFNRLIKNFGQVQTLGRLTSRELNDFAINGIPLLDELANMFGKTKAEIQDMVTAGEIGFKDVEQAFANMSGEGGRFHNLMETQSKTLQGTMSNLGDQFTRVSMSLLGLSTDAETFGQIIEGGAFDILRDMAFKALGALEKLSEWFNSLTIEQRNFILAVGAAAVAIGPLAIALGGLLRVIGVMKVAFAAMSGPVGIAAAALVYFFTQTEMGREILDKINKGLSETNSLMKANAEITRQGNEGIQESAKFQSQLQTAISTSSGVYQELNQKLLTLEQAHTDYYDAIKSKSPEAMKKAQDDIKSTAKEVSSFMKTNANALDQAGVDYNNFSKDTKAALYGVDKNLAQHIANVQKGGDETAGTLAEAAGAYNNFEGQATSSISNVAQSANKLSEPANSALTWGSHLLSNFIAGIMSKMPALTGAISGVVNAVNAIAFSTNPLMPTEIYGEHMIQNFASGAIKATPRVQAAMGNVITIVNAFGQEVKVGINDTAAVFEAYSEKVDETAKSHEDLAAEAGKAMASITRDIQDGVSEASQALRTLKQEMTDIMGEFGEKESASRQKFAEAVVANDERIADLQQQIRESESEVQQIQLRKELEREQAVRQENLELIKSVEGEVTEIKRFNNLSRLQQSVEVFQKEREENQKWLKERLDSYDQELTKAQEKLPELQGLWEERKNLLTQYLGDEIAKNDELNANIDNSIYQIRILIQQLNSLDAKSKQMGISVGALGMPKSARATGGPVSSNSSYLVGERGPEIFTPNQGGKITPNNAMGGSITININGPVSSEAAAEEMMDIVVRRLQQHVKVV